MSRKSKAHAADKFCREIISRFPGAPEIADMFYRDRSIVTGECPDWCALPSSYIASFIAESLNKNGALNALKPYEFAHYLTTALIWSRSKMIYRFDNTLADTLAAQPLDGKIPIEILNYLPNQCIFIERDMVYDDCNVIGFFAWLDWGTKDNIKLLRIDFMRPFGYHISAHIPITGGTIKESLSMLMNAYKHPEQLGEYTIDDFLNAPAMKTITECINLMLYLCSEKPDMPDVTELQTRYSRDSYGNPKRAAQWEVGIRIGAALRKAKKADAQNEAATKEAAADDTATDEITTNGSPRTAPRPHMRRAHWHSFWVGKREISERKLVLRWLPPIPVNIDGEDLPTVVRPVKD
jgi:hypothetical protein